MSGLVDTTDSMTHGDFHTFVVEIEPKMRQALTAALGPELGVEAAAEALAYGWENWDRVSVMDNPPGYLYRVGKRWGTRRRIRSPRQTLFIESATFREIEYEPGLTKALAGLTERQRVVVGLLYGYQWTMSEVGDFIGVSKPTVQSYRDRAMKKLRKSLGVSNED